MLRRSSALNGLAFLHLKKDLDATQIDWVDCQDPAERDSSKPLTSYGIPRPVQSRLAAIRTDLDAFSDNEAHTLMLSGFRMMTDEVQTNLSLPFSDDTKVQWDFLAISDVALRAPNKGFEHVDLLRQLDVGARLLFKTLQLWRGLGWFIAMTVIFAGLAGMKVLRQALAVICVGSKKCNALTLAPGGEVLLNWIAASADAISLLPFGAVVVLLVLTVLIAAAIAIVWLLHRLFRTRKGLSVIVTGVLIVTVGWLVAHPSLPGELALFLLRLDQGPARLVARHPHELIAARAIDRRGAGKRV